MLRFVIGLLAALLFSTAAHAAISPVPTRMYACEGGSVSSPDPQAACNGCWRVTEGLSPYMTPWLGGVWTGEGIPNACAVPPGNTSFNNLHNTVTDVCPANSTLSGGECLCNSGYNESGGSCVVHSVCDVGKARTVNVTAGWARSSRPDAADIVEFFGKPAEHDYNDGTCIGNIAKVEDCWRSQEPAANGLYRLSCDWTMIMTADAMSSGDTNADALKPIPPCPGFLGEINGKPACVGTSSSPLPSNPIPSGLAPPKPGNPTAGVKPTTGEGSGSTGSGRTPASGSGGNTGGPASAAVRPGWTAPSEGEDTGQPCGAPGQPICAVKVDETGTPAEGSAEGRFSQGVTDLGTVKTDADAAFSDHRDIQLPSWTWTFAFPTACTPLVLPAFDDFEIDVCQFQPIIHDLMSVLWVIAGIWGLIALFQRATGT